MQQEQGMTPSSSELLIQIKPRELLDIDDGHGLAVLCVDGVVWITQSNDARDIVLKAGQTFVLDRPGLALVAAPTGPASIIVRKASEGTSSIQVDPPTAGDLRFAA
jgi:Protein of unknown function (DUF2917)